MQYFKIVKPYPGFEVGQVITVSSAQRFADMKKGYGEECENPETVKQRAEEEAAKIKAEKKAAKKDAQNNKRAEKKQAEKKTK